MNDLFDAAQNRAMLVRLEAIGAGAARGWGKMDVAQMLAHCQVPLEVALGEKQLKRGLIGFLFGKIAKKKLLAEGAFERGLPTAPSFKITDARDFAREKGRLAGLVSRFAALGPAGLTREPHPFFGPLTPQEWSALQWKHLDHHFRQFGA